MSFINVLSLIVIIYCVNRSQVDSGMRTARAHTHTQTHTIEAKKTNEFQLKLRYILFQDENEFP